MVKFKSILACCFYLSAMSTYAQTGSFTSPETNDVAGKSNETANPIRNSGCEADQELETLAQQKKTSVSSTMDCTSRMVVLAKYYANGVPVRVANGWRYDTDGPRAIFWYKKAANGGNSEAFFELAKSYLDGANDVTKNYGIARQYAVQGANSSKTYQAARSMNLLGIIYESGYGVSPDKSTALSWYRRAAALHHEQAENKVGALTAKPSFSEGVPTKEKVCEVEYSIDGGAQRSWLNCQYR